MPEIKLHGGSSLRLEPGETEQDLRKREADLALRTRERIAAAIKSTRRLVPDNIDQSELRKLLSGFDADGDNPKLEHQLGTQFGSYFKGLMALASTERR